MKYSAIEELKKYDDYYPDSDLKSTYRMHRDEIMKLQTAIETVWKNQKLDNNEFEILYNGLKNPWVVVYYYVLGEQINKMLGEITGIEKLIDQGIQDKNWQTRFNTVVIMKAINNQDLKTKIIDLGLSDKSKRVREMAEDVKTNYFSKPEETLLTNMLKKGKSLVMKIFDSE